MKPLLVILSLLLAAIYIDRIYETPQPPGILARDEPRQYLLNRSPFRYDRYNITPLADYAIRARVISKENYWFDGGARLSPVDLAVGWGPLSDSRVLDQLDLRQGARWYNWRPKNRQIPPSYDEINSHSANMHIIPASEEVARALRWVRAGDMVMMTGYLVAVQGDDGFRWRSSLSRTDQGAGACELMWVVSLSVE